MKKNKFIKNQDILLEEKTFDYGGSWQRIHDGLYDPIFLEKSFDYIQSNKYKNIFDIGANTGQFAFFPLLDETLNIWSFEPQSEVYDILVKNVKLNSINTTFCFNYALSSNNLEKWINKPDHQQSIEIYGDFASGLATFSENPIRFKKGKSELVNCLTLDYFVNTQSISNIDLIKIDVEGSELSVLKGSMLTLQNFKPDIIIEINSTNLKQCNSSVEELHDFLKKINYNLELDLNGEDFIYVSQDKTKSI